MEVWKKLHLSDKHEVSNLGNIRNARTGKFLVSRIVKGYEQVGISVNGKKHEVKLHRAVTIAFIGHPPTDKHVVAHCNGNPLDNRLGNLRWATITENNRDKQIHGTQNRGVTQHLAKMTEDGVREMRRLRANGISYNALAKQFAVRKYTAQLICQNRTWRHVL